MVEPVLLTHHVDVHVKHLAAARRIFDAVMPELGLTSFKHDDECNTYYPPGARSPFFCLMLDAEPVVGGTMRVAFSARDRDHVNTIAQLAIENGARNVEGPQTWDEYSDDYYAFFFEDHDGNRYEVVHRP